MRYGLPYKGSKNAIASKIIDILPQGKRLVDLFGGGGAIAHCARLSGKWGRVLYNDVDPLVYDYFTKALAGAYENERRWVSREEYYKLRGSDPYATYLYSFGNGGFTYAYGREVEPWKRAIFLARVCWDRTALAEFGVDSDGSREDLVKHHDEYWEKYSGWYTREFGKKPRPVSLESQVRLQAGERLERCNELKGLAIETTNRSYLDYNYEEGDVVYCDIPYEGTSGYKHQTFNLQEFYDWAATREFPVYISSYEINDDRFELVYEVEKRILTSGASNKTRVERLYRNKASKK